MRPLPGIAVCLFAFAAGAGPASDPPADQHEQDRHEAEGVVRAAARELKRAAASERDRWEITLGRTYPGHFQPDAECTAWYDLLADGKPEWRRERAHTRAVEALFDRVVRRLDLGPVPTIRREEFAQFAEAAIRPRSPGEQPPDPNADADLTFRSLDTNESGQLEPEEWTDRLRTYRAGASGNRRIGKAEYRRYFRDRVTVAVELAAGRAEGDDPADRPAPRRAAGGKSGLPGWFADVDADGDGQIGLYEWRKAGLPIGLYRELDLNGDGVLPAAEYQMYARQHPEGLPVELTGAARKAARR